tara:strand:- start:5864 stop:8032 length:2169 start_codon:yes stop_codon:yes gene_type:complete
MAAYTVSYQAPQYGSAAGDIGSRISGAMDAAAVKRREIDQEIADLKKKKQIRGGQLNDEDSARLQNLLTFKASNKIPGTLFASQMISDFGGDRLRRTMGFFQKNPADENDPALDKKQRFTSLINKTMEPQTTRQLELNEETLDDNTKLALSKLTQFLSDSLNGITQKVQGLKQSDTKNTQTLLQTNNNVKEIQRNFAKNNEVQKQSNVIQKDLFDQQVEAAEDRKTAAVENRGENQQQSTGGQGYSFEREGKQGKGLLGNVIDIGKNLLGMGRKGGRGRIKGKTAYSNPIGPQRMFPGRAPAGNTWKPRAGGGFDPIMPSSKLASGGIVKPPTKEEATTDPQDIKLSMGGVLDNPTDIAGMPTSTAVIPKDKMTTAVKESNENQKKSDPMAKLLQLPTMAAGSLLLSTISSVVNKMGGVGKLFRPVLRNFIAPAAVAFGLPASLATQVLAQGSAEAGTGQQQSGGLRSMKDPLSNLKGIMSKFQNAMGMNQTANMAGVLSPGGNVTNAEPVSGYSAISGFGQRVHPITGQVKQHDGIDYAIPQGKLISLKKGGEVVEVKAPTTGREVSGIVRITHPDGTESRYVHLSKVMVRKGQQVSTGQAIGAVGGEPGLPGGGGSTGPHLHFEYYPSTSSGPADGSAVAGQYFMVGGQLNATPPQQSARAASTPRAASSLPSAQHQGPVMFPITPGPANPQQSALSQNIYPSTYLPLYNTENPYLMFTP